MEPKGRTTDRETREAGEDSLHRAVFEEAREAIIVIDGAGIIKCANKAAARLFGYESGELVGGNVATLMPEPDHSAHDRYLAHFLQTGEAKIIGLDREVEARRKDGSLFPVELKVSEMTCGGKRLFVGLVHDLGGRRTAQALAEKLHRDRLSAIEAMATSLAHELNQPLAAAVTYIKTARRLGQLPPERRPSAFEDALELASAQILRAGRIVGHLREFISRGEPDKALVSLHGLIEETCELARPGADKGNIRLSLRLDAENERILADAVQIKQLLVNLIRNAEQAMTTSEKRELVVSTSTPGSGLVRVDIADTGAGLSDDVRAYLSDPFAATDGPGAGLSISREIVEAHYGKISAAPNPGGGSVFSFTLPLAEQAGGA